MQDAQHLDNIRAAQLDKYLATSGLSEEETLEAEALFVRYAYGMGGLPKEVELESFEVVRIDEALSTTEIKALEAMLEDDTNFDLSEEEFFDKYLLLASKMITEKVFGKGENIKSFIDALPAVLEKMDRDFSVEVA